MIFSGEGGIPVRNPFIDKEIRSVHSRNRRSLGGDFDSIATCLGVLYRMHYRPQNLLGR